MYTVQSRRIILSRKDDKVIGFKLLGGDFFKKENAFFEPMTVWRVPKKDKKGIGDITPKRHDFSKQMWREFSVIYNDEKDSNRRSGVVSWYLFLYGKYIIPNNYIMNTAIASVEYGDKDFFVKNVFSDSLTMHSAILSELGRNWRSSIEGEIKHCDELAGEIAFLAQNL